MIDYKISILVASYNAGDTIEQTILSIINQTYKNLELVIIDGGSIDNTVDIIKKYENQGVIWISESDDGLYDALNKGAKIASGNYIQVLGADDCLAHNKVIENVVEYLNKNNSIDILSGQEWAVFDESCRQFLLTNYHAREKEMYRGGMVPHGAMFVKKELLLKYPFDKKYKIVADYKFFLNCYYDKNVKIKFIDDALVYFSTKGLSSNRQNVEREEDKLFLELNLPFKRNVGDDDSYIKHCLRIILDKINLLHIAKKIKFYISVNYLFKKHKCNNIMCRWCKNNTK